MCRSIAWYVLMLGDDSQWGGEAAIVAVIRLQRQILHNKLNDLFAPCHKLELAMHRATAIHPACRHLEAREHVIPKLHLDLLFVDQSHGRAFRMS